MSDPAVGPYTCCGREMQVISLSRSGRQDAYLCDCGVWRYAFSRRLEPERARLVHRLMELKAARREGAQQ